MPYCPKCDMEFIDGITRCTDCGGPLIESKEAAEAIRKDSAKREMLSGGDELLTQDEIKKRNAAFYGHSNLYVNKTQKYQDTKASASAFLCIGGILTIASALLWSGLVQLPLAGTSRFLTFGVLTAMGLGFLAIGLSSLRSIKGLSQLAEEEESRTASIIDEFLRDHSAISLDEELGQELEGLTPEEISLKRLDLIQDILITTHDISDQNYADSLADQLYEQLFPEGHENL